MPGTLLLSLIWCEGRGPRSAVDRLGRRLSFRRAVILMAFVAMSSALALAQAQADTAPARSAFPAPGPPAPPRPAYIGTALTTNSPGWSEVLHGSQAPGVLVLMVAPGSPAQAAGLSAGEVIVALDGHVMHNDEQLGVLLRSRATTDHVLTVLDVAGTARTMVMRSDGTPPGPASELIQQRVTVEPTATHRFVYGRTSPDSETAIAVLDGLTAEFPNFADAHAARAERLLDALEADAPPERTRAPIEAATQAVELEPRSLSAQLAAARAFLDTGDLASASAHAEVALGVDESSAAAHYLLGRSLLFMNEPDRALPKLHRAQDLDPYVQAHYRDLAACYDALGDGAAARDTADALHALQRFEGEGQPASVGGDAGPLALVCAAAVLLGIGAAWWGRGSSLRSVPRRQDLTYGPAPAVTTVVELIAVVGLFSLAVPALGGVLGLPTQASPIKEIIEHVVPGLLVLSLSATALRLELKEAQSEEFLFLMASAVGMAGLWIIGTHVPLLRLAFRGRATPELALFHAAAGPVLIGLAVVLARSARRPAHGITSPVRVRNRRRVDQPRSATPR